MDSGNSSGSMSSGADEEYESRAHSLSSSYMTPPPPFTTATNNTQQHMFLQDPLLSNYLDIMWSKPNNQSDLPASFIIPSSSQQEQAGGVADVATNQQNQGVPVPASSRPNPKKRSRASRRAPTTVLTTDTTNFRAMVQEFTGIPAPPFPRTRFDLFASSSAALMDPSPPPPSYLLRPFPQRLLNNHPLPPPSMVDNSTAINFQQPISSGDVLLKHRHPLSFQNMLQQAPPPNYPSHHHHAAAQVGLRQPHLNNNVNNENRLISSSSNDSSREEWAQRRSDGQGEALYTDVAENTLLLNTAAKVQQQHYSSAPPPSSNTKGTDQCTTQGMLESWINCSSHHNLRAITQYDEDNNNDLQHKEHY